MATEIVFAPLKPDTNPADQQFKDNFSKILKHGGAHRMFVGAQIEHPDIYQLFVDWDNVEHHIKYTQWEGYEAFLQEAMTACAGPISLFHVHLEPFPPTAALAEVTEFIRVYFPVDYSAEDQKTFHDNLVKFGSIVKRDWAECRGTAGGWAVEEVVDPKSSEKAKIYVCWIGWPSVESHMKYRETQSFKDNIHLLRGAKDMKNIEVVHVAMQEFKV